MLGVRASKLLSADENMMRPRTPPKMAPVSTAVAEENPLEWVNKDKRRMLHVVYRVGDLEKTIKYTYLLLHLCHNSHF